VRLVVVAVYRFARNPMYIGVLLVGAGWNAVSGSLLIVYCLVVVVAAFHLRVVFHEERSLSARSPSQ
jgi:protein-S-isoprenylcysteine O-methyltransferase Ste14